MSRPSTRRTCPVSATSWFTRLMPLSLPPRTSPPRCRSLTFPARSSADTLPLVTCVAAVLRAVKINWKMGKETGGEKAEGVTALKTNDAAEVVFEPQQPMVVDRFDRCEGLSRIAFMDGNSAVMLGKVMDVNSEKDW